MISINGLDYREWTEPSESRPGVEYHVRLWLRDFRGFKKDSLSCDCPAWVYARKPLSEKSCKHTRKVEERLQNNEVVREVHGSEVVFNEEVVAKRIQQESIKEEDLTTARVKALFKALQESK